jgi:hypothetical protein
LLNTSGATTNTQVWGPPNIFQSVSQSTLESYVLIIFSVKDYSLGLISNAFGKIVDTASL